MPKIAADNLTKSYGGAPILNAVSFALPDGQWSLIQGQSGAGKTTLIRLIAGLERPDAGSIRFDTKVVSSPKGLIPPEQRGIGMVFQTIALWPHMTVEQHLDFVLRARTRNRKERRRTIHKWLEYLHLADRRKTLPHELSGGEKQRVALARAMCVRPAILLLDEPFTGMDSSLRTELLDLVYTLTSASR